MQLPCAALRPFVKRFLVVESPSAHRDSHLPDAGFVAAFVVSGECVVNGATRVSRAALTGLWETARAHDHGRENTVVIAAFTAVGAAAFLRQPLDEFANATVDVEDFFGRRDDVDRVHEHLVHALNPARRVRLLEEFLLVRATRARTDPLVSAAVSWIEESQAKVRIEEIARRVGLSQSALERRFRRSVGATPRQFASIVRVQHVSRLRAAGHDFTTIAHAAGFYDQPHFNRDFKRIAGVAPAEYFAGAAAG